jgi:hypothetical protein
MIRIIRRLAAAGFLAGMLIATVMPTASAWISGNACTVPSICVSRDDGNGVPRAVTLLTDDNYAGDLYFNTTDPIDNTVSSLWNRFTSNDVLFTTSPAGGGSSFCVNSGKAEPDLGFAGFGWDDKFSSHAKVTGNLCN